MPSKVRSRLVSVLLTDAEHAHLTRLVWRKHTTISSWIRTLVVKAIVEEAEARSGKTASATATAAAATEQTGN